MRITRRQSILISVGIVAMFVAVGVLTARRGNSRAISEFARRDAEVMIPVTEEGAEDSAGADSGAAVDEPVLGEQPPAVEEERASLALQSFHRVETRDGKPLWEIRAEKGEYRPKEDSAVITNATVTLYDEKGEKTELQAKQSKVLFKDGGISTVDARDEVRVARAGEFEITMDAAHYDHLGRSVSTDSPLEITFEAGYVRGVGLTADLEKRQFSVREQVVTEIKSRGAPRGEPTASDQ